MLFIICPANDKKGPAFGNRDVAAFFVVTDPLFTIMLPSMMRFLPKSAESRREFFRTGARCGLLTVLGVAVALVSKRRLAGQRCINRGVCGGCAAFERCGLPQALSAKQAQAGG